MRGLGILGRSALTIIALLALVTMCAGAVVAGFVGSDDTVYNRPAQLGGDGRPLLTAPDLLAYEGVTVTLRASAPRGVFIGTAHPVDVADFFGDSSRTRLTKVTRSGVVAEDLGSARPVEPTSAHFWLTSMRGHGVEELALDRDTAAAQWVIAPVAGEGPTTVSFGVTVPGVFHAGLIAFGVGAVVLVVTVEVLLALRRRRRGRRGPRPPRSRLPSARAADHIAPYVPSPDPLPPVGSGGKHRAHRTALATVLTTVLAVSLAGCTWEEALPARRQSSELATTKVALTRAELPALLKSYDSRLSDAIRAARPPRYATATWRRADGGPALESDLFGTRVARLTQLGSLSLPSHDPVAVFSPRFDSYPMWSLVSSLVGGESRVDLFTKASVQAQWLRQAGTSVSGALPAPGRPGRAPNEREVAAATAAWSDYLRTGALDDRLRLDPESKAWRGTVTDLGDRVVFRGFDISVEAAVKHGLPRIVQVEDGALAIVALRTTTRLHGRPDLMVGWNPPYGSYRPSAGGVLSFAHLAVGVIHLPDKGAATLLGSTFSEVAVGR